MMISQHSTFVFAGNFFRATGMLLIAFGLYACAATPVPDSGTTTQATAANPNTTDNSAEQKPDTPMTGEDTTKDVVPVSAGEASTEKAAEQMAETTPVRIDVSCKNEPYSKYEKQARDSIAKGLSATQAGTYGVGFRDLDEHKKWSETHSALFNAVNKACVALSKCAEQHPKDKSKQCEKQAEEFSQWQNLSKNFAAKAKQSETVQPPIICSFTPDINDPAHCFHNLGDNIDKACGSASCKKASDCWRSIGFLDYAINQAASACRFARQELTECRGYATATKRRKEKFERCETMHKSLNIHIIPVL